jgi:hypothetical protein
MMKKQNLLVLVLVVSMALIAPKMLTAKTHLNVVKGTIKGSIADDLDAHLLIETNLVLLARDGRYYYLSNMPRTVKVSHVDKNVQVTGKVNGESIIVDKFEVREGNTYKIVWSQEKQEREFINFFQNLPMG